MRHVTESRNTEPRTCGVVAGIYVVRHVGHDAANPACACKCEAIVMRLLKRIRSHCEMKETRTPGSIGLLTGPHQTSSLDPGSFTIRLSDGERPVFAPEYAERAPVEVMAEPVS